MDDFERARELKAIVLDNVAIFRPTHGSSSERTAPPASEDTLIATLRAQGNSWADITIHLNSLLISINQKPVWTKAAVYSRFILYDSEAATPAREVGFEPRDYAHIKNVGTGRVESSKAGKKRVKDFHNATELSANIRNPAIVVATDGVQAEAQGDGDVEGKGKRRSKAKGKDEERRKGGSKREMVKMDANTVEALMRAVLKVERSFWVFVADELEREAGKFIDPKELEKVFHSV